MIRFLARRLAALGVVLLGLSLITFVLARVIPAMPRPSTSGRRARPEDIARVPQQLGSTSRCRSST